MCRLKRSTTERNKNRHDLFEFRSKHSRAEHFQDKTDKRQETHDTKGIRDVIKLITKRSKT